MAQVRCRLTHGLALFAGLLMCAASFHACAEDIHIGQTVGFTGPQAGGVKELTDGAKLWINAINARGGIGGQKIVLDSIDDGFDPKRAAENAGKLIDSGVVALFLSRGTPQSEAVIPLAEKAGVALVAPSTGAQVMHEPLRRVLFNVRSKYQNEAERAVRHLATVAMNRIGVVYVDSSFGKDALVGAERGLKNVGIKAEWVLKFDGGKPDFSPIIDAIVKSKVQAVMVFGTGAQPADLINSARAAGADAQFVTLSNNSSSSFVKLLGSNARGVIVTQVFPNPRHNSHAILLELQKLAKDAGMEPSYATLEGFVSAKVLVEGLRRAAARGPITRARLIEALETLKNFDLGGMQLSYSPTDHSGLDYIEISIINSKGEFLQ